MVTPRDHPLSQLLQILNWLRDQPALLTLTSLSEATGGLHAHCPPLTLCMWEVFPQTS